MSFTSINYKEYPIRLHSRRDLDLVTLYMNDKHFKRKVIKALSDYAKGIKPIYSLDDVTIDKNDALKNGNIVYKSQYMHIVVNPKTYPEVVELLAGIRYYYRCDFIKCIIKNALPIPVAGLYFTNYRDISLEVSNNEVIEKSKKERKKEKLEKVKPQPIADTEETINYEEDYEDDYSSSQIDTFSSNVSNDNYPDILDGLIENY